MNTPLKEINRKEDAEELRLLLVALREENELLKNRESERLRAEAEMSLLYRQMEDEVKGLRKENASLTKENADLREKLERASTGNALKANTIFGRRTEKLTDLICKLRKISKCDLMNVVWLIYLFQKHPYPSFTSCVPPVPLPVYPGIHFFGSGYPEEPLPPRISLPHALRLC